MAASGSADGLDDAAKVTLQQLKNILLFAKFEAPGVGIPRLEQVLPTIRHRIGYDLMSDVSNHGRNTGPMIDDDHERVMSDFYAAVASTSALHTPALDIIVAYARTPTECCRMRAIFVLMWLVALRRPELTAATYRRLDTVATQPSDLFVVVKLATKANCYRMCQETIAEGKGWGRGLRGFLTRAYLRHSPEQLLDLLTASCGQHGWTHKDIIKLLHMRAPSDEYGVVLCGVLFGYEKTARRFLASGSEQCRRLLARLLVIRRFKTADTSQAALALHERSPMCAGHFQPRHLAWPLMVPSFVAVMSPQQLLDSLTTIGHRGFFKPAPTATAAGDKSAGSGAGGSTSKATTTNSTTATTTAAADKKKDDKKKEDKKKEDKKKDEPVEEKVCEAIEQAICRRLSDTELLRRHRVSASGVYIAERRLAQCGSASYLEKSTRELQMLLWRSGQRACRRVEYAAPLAVRQQLRRASQWLVRQRTPLGRRLCVVSDMRAAMGSKRCYAAPNLRAMQAASLLNVHMRSEPHAVFVNFNDDQVFPWFHRLESVTLRELADSLQSVRPVDGHFSVRSLLQWSVEHNEQPLEACVCISSSRVEVPSVEELRRLGGERFKLVLVYLTHEAVIDPDVEVNVVHDDTDIIDQRFKQCANIMMVSGFSSDTPQLIDLFLSDWY